MKKHSKKKAKILLGSTYKNCWWEMKKMGMTDEEKKRGKAPKNILKVHTEKIFSKPTL